MLKRIFKKLLLCLALALLAGALCAVAASAATVASGNCGAQGSNLTWTLDDMGKLTISGTGAMKDYASGGPPWYSKNVKCVVIENGVTYIGRNAFNSYTCQITSLSLPNTLTSIGDYAFSGYKSTSLLLPNSLISIGDYAFSNSSCSGTLSFPAGLKSIGANAFWNSTSLTGVSFPDSLESIGEKAFMQTGLTAVLIPKNVSSIGAGAFSRTKIVQFSVDAANDYYKVASKILYSKDGKVLIAYPHGNATSYGWSVSPKIEIDSSVRRIESWAFYDCKLAKVTIPLSVEEIGDNAFRFCTLSKLDFIYWAGLPVNLKSIGAYAFYNCIYLGERLLGVSELANNRIFIPSSVETIGEYAFSSCDMAPEVYVQGVSEIKEETFSGCTNLRIVRISEDVTEIDSAAFKSCTNISDVYYSGTRTAWEEITIGNDNTPLTNANMHYAKCGVTFNANGGTGTMDPLTVPTGTAAVLSENAFSRACFAFAGWNTMANGTGDPYDDLAKLTLTDDLTLYAQWRRAAEITSVDNTEVDGTPACVAQIRCEQGVNATAYAARYDGDGRFLSVEKTETPLTAGEVNSFSVARNGAAVVRFFVLDERFAPLCNAVEVR